MKDKIIIERNVVLKNGNKKIYITNTCNNVDRRKEASDIICGVK